MRMGDDRILKRAMLGALEGGEGYGSAQQLNWVRCLERDLHFFDMEEEEEAGGWKTSAKEPAPI